MLAHHVYITRATLGHVTSTDEDVVVKFMARKAREGLERLSNALLGLGFKRQNFIPRGRFM